ATTASRHAPELLRPGQARALARPVPRLFLTALVSRISHEAARGAAIRRGSWDGAVVREGAGPASYATGVRADGRRLGARAGRHVGVCEPAGQPPLRRHGQPRHEGPRDREALSADF